MQELQEEFIRISAEYLPDVCKGLPSYSLHQLHCYAAERGAVLTDSVLRHRFGIALESRLGGYSTSNAIALLLVLTRRSVGARVGKPRVESDPGTHVWAKHLPRGNTSVEDLLDADDNRARDRGA